MRSMILPAAIAVGCAALLGACSKSANTAANDTASAASDTAATASNATAGATDAGGAVSPPNSPQNGAVNTDANKDSSTQTPGSNSFTESQAKGHIENAGYSDVTALQKTPDGLWTATAKKGGKTVHVVLDFKGAVTAQ